MQKSESTNNHNDIEAQDEERQSNLQGLLSFPRRMLLECLENLNKPCTFLGYLLAFILGIVVVVILLVGALFVVSVYIYLLILVLTKDDSGCKRENITVILWMSINIGLSIPYNIWILYQYSHEPSLHCTTTEWYAPHNVLYCFLKGEMRRTEHPPLQDRPCNQMAVFLMVLIELLLVTSGIVGIILITRKESPYMNDCLETIIMVVGNLAVPLLSSMADITCKLRV